jgi:hypothetical protein
LENTATGQRAIWFLKNGGCSPSTYLQQCPVQWHIAVLVILTATAMLTWFGKTRRHRSACHLVLSEERCARPAVPTYKQCPFSGTSRVLVESFNGGGAQC